MADQRNGGIAWTDETWNPVTGCTKVSQGCKFCYAERVFPRAYGKQKVHRIVYDKLRKFPRKFTDVRCHPERLDQPLHWKRPRRIFVNSMSDLFHESISTEFLLAVWAVMEATPRHTYQLLTKRPKRMQEMLRDDGLRIKEQPPYERRPIPNWSGYYADTEGAIWSDRRGTLRRLSPGVEERGHMHVMLCSGAGMPTKLEKVHRLVLMTFDRMPLEGEEARHLDGDPSQNRISNLSWGTRSENGDDRVRHGHAITNRKLNLSQIAEIRIAALSGEAQRSIARRFDTSHMHVSRVLNGYTWGFKPLPNVQLGVSGEDQETFDERTEHLARTPAAIRFVSLEPLLGPISMKRWLHLFEKHEGDELCCEYPRAKIDWVIVGGESGPNARPFNIQWARDIIAQCKAAGVPCFVKQLGTNPTEGVLKTGSNNEWDNLPIVRKFRDHKGGDWNEWPEDLRVREFPNQGSGP